MVARRCWRHHYSLRSHRWESLDKCPFLWRVQGQVRHDVTPEAQVPEVFENGRSFGPGMAPTPAGTGLTSEVPVSLFGELPCHLRFRRGRDFSVQGTAKSRIQQQSRKSYHATGMRMLKFTLRCRVVRPAVAESFSRTYQVPLRYKMYRSRVKQAKFSLGNTPANAVPGDGQCLGKA